MPSLLENNMLLQLLSAGGQDILAGQPIGTNVHGVLMQGTRAKAYLKFLQEVLAGGGKMTMDKDTMSIKAPMTALQGPGGVPAGTTGATNPGALNQMSSGSFPSITGQPKAQTQDDQANLLASFLGGNLSSINPSSSPLDVSGADLAGLTPQDISQALQFRFSQEEIGRRAPSELLNDLYNVAMIEESQARIGAREAGSEQFPVPVPGLGAVSLNEWRALPPDTQSYAAYVYQSKLANPTEPVMTQEEWKRVAGDTKIRFLEELMDRPELLAIEERLREKGATKLSIGEKVASKRSLDWVDFEGKLPSDVNKFMQLPGNRFKAEELGYDPGTTEYRNANAKLKAGYIEAQILTRGTIIDREFDPETGVGTWTVKLKNGETETLTYGLYE